MVKKGFVCQSKFISRIPLWMKLITLLTPSIPKPPKCTWIFETNTGGEE
jgi:hypothetical protein